MLGNPKGIPLLLTVAIHFILLPFVQSQDASTCHEYEEMITKTPLSMGNDHFTFYYNLFSGSMSFVFSSLYCNLHCSVTLEQIELLLLAH